MQRRKLKLKILVSYAICLYIKPFYKQTSEKKPNKSQDMWKEKPVAAALQHAGMCVWPIKLMCLCSSSKTLSTGINTDCIVDR